MLAPLLTQPRAQQLTSSAFQRECLQWGKPWGLCFMFRLGAEAQDLWCSHLQEHPALSLCLTHLSATAWTKTPGLNTLKTSEKFSTVPRPFNFCLLFFPLISSYYNWVGNGFVAPQWKPFPESFTFSRLLQRKMGSPKNGAVRTPPGDPNLCQCPGRDLSQDPPELVGPWMAEESSGKGTFGAGLNLWDFY